MTPQLSLVSLFWIIEVGTYVAVTVVGTFTVTSCVSTSVTSIVEVKSIVVVTVLVTYSVTTSVNFSVLVFVT